MYQGEKLNSISHLAGAVLALVGLGALLSVGVQTGDSWIFASFAVFGLSLVLLYTMSTLYHSFCSPELKRLFRVFDHLSIYLLIAGTYTPFMLVCLRDSTGWYILGVVWALAVLGALSELFLSGRAVRIGLRPPGSAYCTRLARRAFTPLYCDFPPMSGSLPRSGLRGKISGRRCGR